MPDEIDFSDGVRGKYYERFKDGDAIHIVSDEEDPLSQSRLADETGQRDVGAGLIASIGVV